MIDEQARNHDETVSALQARITELEAQIAAVREQERVLREREELYWLIVENSSDLISVIDQDARFHYVSPSFRYVLGYLPNQLTGSSPFDILHPEDEPAFRKQWQRIESNGAMRLTFRYRHANKTWHWIEASGVMIDEAQGFKVILTGRDITEHRAAEAERTAMNEELLRMQSAMLAELSTPLIPITERVLVMPLIGTIDTRRAAQILETLLQGVQSHRASVVIVDITGVSVVDTQVAAAIVQAAQAVRLLGAQVVLTGIRPEVAETLVGLSAELGGVLTFRDLQRGVAYALSQRGGGSGVL